MRQVASRARKHVEARRPRVDVPPDAVHVVERFFAAATGDGDVQGLLDLMAPDMVLLSDGGGVKKAALRPTHGHHKVARFLAGIGGQAAHLDMAWSPANGRPATVNYADGELDNLATLVVRDGVVAEIHYVRNSEKLRHLDLPRTLTRA